MRFRFFLVLAIIAIAVAALIIYRPWLKENPEDVRLKAWGVFNSYLEANKNHDVEKVGALSRKLSNACSDENMQAECFARMDYVVELTTDFKIEDFSNILFDNKQVVLFTDFKLIDQDEVESKLYQYERSLIFFVRDENGNPKITGLNPSEIWSVNKDSKVTNEVAAKEKLSKTTEDIDGDALPDSYEPCTGPIDEPCDGMRPGVRDTDDDGWWDGLEEFLIN